MTQAYIHLATHEHHVVTSPSREIKDTAHDFIKHEYDKTLTTTPSAITMSASKVFFGPKLIGPSDHSSDIRNTSIFRSCSKRSIFKYFFKNIIMIQRLENWPLYQVFSSIF
jgi:hypothetical protein